MTEKEMARGDLLRTLPEAQTYLDDIDSNPETPMLLKVSGQTIDSEVEMAYLSAAAEHLQRIDAPLVITHGGGPQINAALNQQGFEGEFDEKGLRITPPEAMPFVERALIETTLTMEQSLNERGAKIAVLDDVLGAVPLDEAKYGMVGKPSAIDYPRIIEVIKGGQIAVIPCLGRTALNGRGRALNVNGDDAAAALVKALSPLHYMAITEEGGVRNGAGRIEPVITPDIAGDLIDQKVLDGGMKKKVDEAFKLIKDGGTDSVVLASARNIIRELFTHKGAGSLITREASIKDYQKLSGVHTAEVRDLIENAFGGHLAEEYFEQSDIDRTYITSQRYDGVAIVRAPETVSARYMDKLAVAPRAQGRGVARQILESVIEDSESGLFWRADPSAVFLELYDKLSDSSEKVVGTGGREWRVFYKNVDSKEAQRALMWAAGQPVTIDRHPEDAPF